ncbi:MAG: DUF188 domain-containing protein [Eubacteriales bacterium]|nr:DUF188 domain-containing protein [Bacillota bacterium]MBV1727588.1 DUF188 domain-containing protein [Desulforudis sp.]MDP3049995.1 DUF188 domain-containing protein [Eubacteriales bacterium]MDQ7789719.1 DUF188 domain-containing protein [Clostridia bacterium]MBU4532833.1 DUF188 domain-containing protein [Bacillota bacterium]
MPKIIVDADACPRNVLAACTRSARAFGLELITVANFHHHIDSKQHIVVGGDSQEADIKIVNLTQPGDVVVTQDWGLAALVLGRQAYAISPGGREYRPETIEFLLEEREVKARIRRSGGRTKGPKARSAGQDTAFVRALEALLSRITSN